MSETVRARVLAFVRRYPATHAREVERRLGLSDRLGAYHLGRLVEEGMLRQIRERGYTRYWLRDDFPAKADVRLERLLRRKHAHQITLLLLANPQMTQGDIASRLGLSKATTSYHLALLKEARVVDAHSEGRRTWYSAQDPVRLRALLARLPPLPGPLDEFSELWDDLVR